MAGKSKPKPAKCITALASTSGGVRTKPAKAVARAGSVEFSVWLGSTAVRPWVLPGSASGGAACVVSEVVGRVGARAPEAEPGRGERGGEPRGREPRTGLPRAVHHTLR